jgi:hypothetical protein
MRVTRIALLVVILFIGLAGSPKPWEHAAPRPMPVSSCPGPPSALPTITWSSTQKVEQVIGDIDWTCSQADYQANRCQTASQTFTRGGVLGNGNGYSFIHTVDSAISLVFLFGDTIANGTWYPNWNIPAIPAIEVGDKRLNYHAGDPFAMSTSLDPTKPLVLDFVLDPKKNKPKQPEPLLIKPTDCTIANGCVQPMADPFNGFLAWNLECTQRVRHGGDDIPNSGISVGGNIYMTFNTNSCIGCNCQCGVTIDCGTGTCNNAGYYNLPAGYPCDAHANDYSVLVRYDPGAKEQFKSARVISHVDYTHDVDSNGKVIPNTTGHFIFTSTHHVTPDMGLGFSQPMILTFGVGHYRNDNIYLSVEPDNPADYEAGDQIQYLTNVQLGQTANDAIPIWTPPGFPEPSGLDNQSGLYPVVVDNPYCASPAPTPSIGKVSVAYSQDLGLWLMTFNGGGNVSNSATGLYFTYAAKPWGPWAPPQLIYNPCSNSPQGFGDFIHWSSQQARGCKGVPTSGPAGPTGQGQDPLTLTGEAFGPFMIEPYITAANGTLTIDYTMSTLNPYTVVRMRSVFKYNQP